MVFAMLQNFSLFLKRNLVYILLIAISISIGYILISNQGKLEKKLLKNERLFRDSLSKEIKILHQERIFLNEEIEILNNKIKNSEESINLKINRLKYEPKKTVDYVNITNDSLFKRLLPKD